MFLFKIKDNDLFLPRSHIHTIQEMPTIFIYFHVEQILIRLFATVSKDLKSLIH